MNVGDFIKINDARYLVLAVYEKEMALIKTPCQVLDGKMEIYLSSFDLRENDKREFYLKQVFYYVSK